MIAKRILYIGFDIIFHVTTDLLELAHHLLLANLISALNCRMETMDVEG